MVEAAGADAADHVGCQAFGLEVRAAGTLNRPAVVELDSMEHRVQLVRAPRLVVIAISAWAAEWKSRSW